MHGSHPADAHITVFNFSPHTDMQSIPEGLDILHICILMCNVTKYINRVTAQFKHTPVEIVARKLEGVSSTMMRPAFMKPTR